MKRILTFCCSLVLLSSPAFAGVAWDWNFSALTGGAIPNITNIDQAQIIVGSVLGFRDGLNPGNLPGQIDAGDTFQDFTAVRFTTMTNSVGGNVTPLTYGSGPGRNHEVTALATFSGVQITNNSYLVTPGSLAGAIYADAGAAFTGSDFFDLTTFSDGTAVETFGVPVGLGGGVNFGPTAPDGTIDLVFSLTDLLGQTGEAFELSTLTGLPFDPTTLLGFIDANNFGTPPQNPLGGLNGGVNGVAAGGGYADLFPGLTGTQLPNGTITSLSFGGVPFDFAFAARSEGSFNKDIVPEPTSLAIFGAMGLSLIGTRRRRTRS